MNSVCGRPASVTASWILIVFLVAGGCSLGARWQEARDILRHRRAAIFKVLAIAAAVGLLFLVVRLFNPAIHWGEKPMDFSFLNSFMRSSAWPPMEPWMAGMSLHYYYFGEVLAAYPILITGCSTAVGYNLMSATIPALGDRGAGRFRSSSDPAVAVVCGGDLARSGDRSRGISNGSGNSISPERDGGSICGGRPRG